MGLSRKCSKSFKSINSISVMLIFGLWLFFSDAVSSQADDDFSLPYFLEPIPNKTVVVGREVILPCAVENLKGYKVAWIFVETQTILTIHHTIISKNRRFSLARNDHKHWYLKISDVRPTDRGFYMCQVNSDPMMSQKGYLEVQVPPDIIDEDTSSEVVVQEGRDVSLRCTATGSPRPKISWKREDGGKIHLGKGINVKVTDSEILNIPKVSRLHMGPYLCIASNDVPPSVSKRIVLRVQFAPVLWIPNQLVGVSSGMDVSLECHTEAYPRSINYWTDTSGNMILGRDRFDSIIAENGYKAYMKLKIVNIQPEDFGTYGCSAKNSLGESNGDIKIYEIPRQMVETTTLLPPENTTTTSPSNPSEHLNQISSDGQTIGKMRSKYGRRNPSNAIFITPDGEYVYNNTKMKPNRDNRGQGRRVSRKRPPTLLSDIYGLSGSSHIVPLAGIIQSLFLLLGLL